MALKTQGSWIWALARLRGGYRMRRASWDAEQYDLLVANGVLCTVSHTDKNDVVRHAATVEDRAAKDWRPA